MRVRSMLFAVAIIVLLLPHLSEAQIWKELMSEAESLHVSGHTDSTKEAFLESKILAKAEREKADTNTATALFSIAANFRNSFAYGEIYCKRVLEIRMALLDSTERFVYYDTEHDQESNSCQRL